LGAVARTKLIVEITTRDDKTQRHECIDFPFHGDRFITLYKPNFVREAVLTESVLRIRQFFE
jgi:hypothetical protein